jgi:hypothetical protein
MGLIANTSPNSELAKSFKFPFNNGKRGGTLDKYSSGNHKQVEKGRRVIYYLGAKAAR